MSDLNEKFACYGAVFTMNFLNKITAEGIRENIIFSPFSIQACMALAFAGAQGETCNEIATVMKYVSNSQADVAATFRYVLEKYKKSTQLKIANRVYVQNNYDINDCYQQALKKYYHSDAENVNFADNVNTAKAINLWVESKTDGNIKELITPDSINDATRIVLINALHFKGNWKSNFLHDQTAKGIFWIGNNESINIDFMYQFAEFGFGYFPYLKCTALEMPYKDTDLSMFVLLPIERDGLKHLATKLKSINLIDLIKKMGPARIDVRFPKFKVDFSIELNETLKKLGLNVIFDNPNFSNMLASKDRLKVSKILHKVCIEVNEVGTEAAGATGMMNYLLSVPTLFTADHPFLYIIWNKKNILFVGAFVNAPKA